MFELLQQPTRQIQQPDPAAKLLRAPGKFVHSDSRRNPFHCFDDGHCRKACERAPATCKGNVLSSIATALRLGHVIVSQKPSRVIRILVLGDSRDWMLKTVSWTGMGPYDYSHYSRSLLVSSLLVPAARFSNGTLYILLWFHRFLRPCSITPWTFFSA